MACERISSFHKSARKGGHMWITSQKSDSVIRVDSFLLQSRGEGMGCVSVSQCLDMTPVTQRPLGETAHNRFRHRASCRSYPAISGTPAVLLCDCVRGHDGQRGSLSVVQISLFCSVNRPWPICLPEDLLRVMIANVTSPSEVKLVLVRFPPSDLIAIYSLNRITLTIAVPSQLSVNRSVFGMVKTHAG